MICLYDIVLLVSTDDAPCCCVLHRGILGKKCGSIILSAEELGNCRVSNTAYTLLPVYYYTLQTAPVQYFYTFQIAPYSLHCHTVLLHCHTLRFIRKTFVGGGGV